MSKKECQQWLKNKGYSSAYSGNTKTMHVQDIGQEYLESFELPISFNMEGHLSSNEDYEGTGND